MTPRLQVYKFTRKVAAMAETHVISALRAKRAEVSGYIHDLEKKVKTWRARLAHIDATIKIFSPEIDPEAIPPRRTYRRSDYFKKGEFARLVLTSCARRTASRHHGGYRGRRYQGQGIAG